MSSTTPRRFSPAHDIKTVQRSADWERVRAGIEVDIWRDVMQYAQGRMLDAMDAVRDAEDAILDAHDLRVVISRADSGRAA